MNIEELKEPLSVEEIDFRIQSINNGKYATILAYKDARADMNRLDKVCGALNWKREHTRDNHNCIVSIWDESKKQWISKEDTGIESMAEKEKGLASDSFKRACFNWGIGRELYDYPVIQIQLNDTEVQETGKPKPKYRASYNLKINEWTWETKFKDGKLVTLIVKDTKGAIRFQHGQPKNISNAQLQKLADKIEAGDLTVDEAIKKCEDNNLNLKEEHKRALQAAQDLSSINNVKQD